MVIDEGSFHSTRALVLFGSFAWTIFIDSNALPAAPGYINGQQGAGRARRQRFVPYVADDRYRSLNRTGPRAYGLAIERRLRRSRGLIEETGQRTQDRHINQESAMEFESDIFQMQVIPFLKQAAFT
ncbi:unnamed protein product [Cylicocyclus nassatus]|uniref:Uncharacterized protein n=1 Tax=Cylicocyclus nassatus TaxID=53992 RepID=A0AA36M913_CYLNA|nr:unnamed protein product [Cylicocyclus nassatus]